jgi:GNAT superfamily N-acetyltransferase
MVFAPSDTVERSTFEAIFQALDGASRDVIGPAAPRLLVIPLRGDTGQVVGGLWAVSLFGWLQLEMLFVPDALRGLGIGSALLAVAETEARTRGCVGITVDTFSFQAAPFYEKMGFSTFGVLDNCPPGHSRLFLCKRLIPTGAGADCYAGRVGVAASHEINKLPAGRHSTEEAIFRPAGRTP